jgi:hypothetical protein
MQTCSKANTSLSQTSVSAASPSPLIVSSRNSVMTASQLSVVSSGKNTCHSSSTDSYHYHSQQQKVSHPNSVANESSKLSVSSGSTTGFKFSPPPVPPRPFTSYYTKSSTSNSDTSEVAQSSSTSEPTHRNVQQHIVQSPLKSLENATNNLSLYTCNNASNMKLPVSQTTSDNTVTPSNYGSLTSTSVHACTSASPVLSSSSTTSASALCKCEPTTAAKPTLDTRALAEASRNLTQTLKQLSSEVLTSRSDPAEVSSLN